MVRSQRADDVVAAGPARPRVVLPHTVVGLLCRRAARAMSAGNAA